MSAILIITTPAKGVGDKWKVNIMSDVIQQIIWAIADVFDEIFDGLGDVVGGVGDFLGGLS